MENCWEEAPHGSQDYYPNYNLFQSSIFYDTDNFRVSYLSYRYDDCSPTESGTRCCEEQERSAEPPDKPAEAEAAVTPATGPPRPLIITKEELYQDPDLFESRNENVHASLQPEPPFLSDSRPWGYDWTKQSWVKAGHDALVVMRQKAQRNEEWNSKKKLYQQLVNAPKVSISKAETMMQKMGWHGGALGKTNKGIVDPVTPDPQYGFGTRSGFGQRTAPAPPPAGAPAASRGSRRDVFRTNVLQHLLHFVKDDTEIELVFDAALRQHERRFIHTLVHSVINEQNVASLSSVAQYDLVADICRSNQYELCTVSDGEPPQRQLSIYKEAPEHVYLVTPDDFQPKTDDPTNESDNPKDNDSINIDSTTANDDKATNDTNDTQDAASMDMDDDENPFLKSIKKSIKKDDEPKSITNKFEKDCNIAKETEVVEKVCGVEAKMVEFFLEFAEAKEYKVLRFLGKFTTEQMAVVNNLLNDVATCIEDLDGFKGKKDILKVFKTGNMNLRLKEGLNGTTEIHKVPPQLSSKNIK